MISSPNPPISDPPQVGAWFDGTMNRLHQGSLHEDAFLVTRTGRIRLLHRLLQYLAL